MHWRAHSRKPPSKGFATGHVLLFRQRPRNPTKPMLVAAIRRHQNPPIASVRRVPHPPWHFADKLRDSSGSRFGRWTLLLRVVGFFCGLGPQDTSTPGQAYSSKCRPNAIFLMPYFRVLSVFNELLAYCGKRSPNQKKFEISEKHQKKTIPFERKFCYCQGSLNGKCIIIFATFTLHFDFYA